MTLFAYIVLALEDVAFHLVTHFADAAHPDDPSLN